MDGALALQALQMFLTGPEKIESLNQSAKEKVDVVEKKFTILESIKEKKDETIREC
jgi:hypothetical protein